VILELSWRKGGRRELAGLVAVIFTNRFEFIAAMSKSRMLTEVLSSKRTV
jgi:hypothetical protein